MRIVAVLPHFTPDLAPTGIIGARLITELGALGIRTDVVTSLPWYAQHAVEPQWKGRFRHVERTGFGTVTRLHPFPTGDKRNIPRRAVGFSAFCAYSALTGAVGPRVDAVLAMSPPLPIAATGWLVAKARRAPFVLNIQDVFPDAAVELGALSNPSAIRAGAELEKWSYARASAVTVLSEDMRANLAAKTDPAKLHIIPNFADTQAIRPTSRDNAYRREFGLGDRTVVMYAGNVGMSQSLELLVEAARHFRNRDDLVFVVNGGGSGLSPVQQLAAGLDNVVFVPMQPMKRLPEVLAAADLHLVLLHTGLAKASVPSKIYSILSAGRPVLASVDPGTEIERIIDSSGAGACVGPDDAAAFVTALEGLLTAPELLPARGAAGRRWVEAELTPAGVARHYADLLESVASGHSKARP